MAHAATSRARSPRRLTREEARFVIRHEGPGLDTASTAKPIDLTEMESTDGRGRTLIQTFMDEVTFNERGSEVTMVKRSSP